LSVVARLAVAAVAAAVFVPGASAKTVTSYCSPSGDLCYGVIDRAGSIRLELTTFARYFGRYGLCVRRPDGVQRCGTFPVVRSGRLWGSSVRFRRQFPGGGAGTYRVTWRLGMQALGPTLRIRVPLR
jgi:hypothetical protein